MTIGIIVAMSKELRLILPLIEGMRETTHGSTLFYEGTVGRNRVALMECGIGKVNAAVGAALMIEYFRPDLVVSSGVGASASGDVAVMDTVIATGVVHHDFWCIGEDWGRVPGSPRVLPAESFESIIPDAPGVKRGLIASGDLFVSSREEVDRILSHFPEAKAIDMESAAIAQVCASADVPFFGMRVISDSPWASHDNSRQYDDFWEDAPRHSFNLVRQLLISL